MSLFHPFKKKSPAKQPEQTASDGVIDDVTFIRELRHISQGPWHQYDVLLDARGYGWDAMLDWADYLAQADLEHVDQVTAAPLGAQERNVTESYAAHDGRCTQTPELQTEMSALSVAGISKTLRAPVKIVWFNQTQVFRLFTLVDDEPLMRRYIETVIRRTFGTADGMKPAKPQPKG